MILYKWRDLVTEAEVLSQLDFENEMNDKFEAMMIDQDKDIPSVIWTSNYVIQIKPSSRMYKDVMFIKMPRNPNEAV